MLKKIIGFFKVFFVRSERVELAVRVARALNCFTETKADDIISYVVGMVAPETAAGLALIEGFLNNDLPVLLRALEMIDASDETNVRETNVNAVVSKVLLFCKTVDKTTLKKVVSKSFDSGNKLSLAEAKEILKEYVK